VGGQREIGPWVQNEGYTGRIGYGDLLHSRLTIVYNIGYFKICRREDFEGSYHQMRNV
jgi:hypothetical protein